MPATELARRLHRPVEQVRARRRRLGLQRPAARPYTRDDDDALRAAWTSGRSLDELAVELARTPEALLLRARWLDLYRSAQRQRWTSSEDATLRDGYANGLTCDEIGRALTRRTPTAVAARASRLGLATYARRWSPEDDRQLSKALAAGRGRRGRTRARAHSGGHSTPGAQARGHQNRPFRPPSRGKPLGRRGRRVSAPPPPPEPCGARRRLGRSDHAVVARLRRLGLREGRQRSPHHPSPTNGGLTPGERPFSIASFAPAVAEQSSCSDTVSIAVALNCGSPPMPYRVQTAPGQSVGSG